MFFGLFAEYSAKKNMNDREVNMNRVKNPLIILVTAYSLFVGSGVNSTIAALIVMAGLFGTLKVFAKI